MGNPAAGDQKADFTLDSMTLSLNGYWRINVIELPDETL